VTVTVFTPKRGVSLFDTFQRRRYMPPSVPSAFIGLAAS
jgi:hypothetical protein